MRRLLGQHMSDVEVIPAATARPQDRAAELDAEVWAMAYVVAEIMDGRRPVDVVDELPSDVRRRVIAVRHHTGPLAAFGVRARDQHGLLPMPPPRASVMRDRVRTIDAEPLPDAAL